MRILIADDEHLARLTLRSMIEDLYPNYSIQEVSNGKDLISLALSFRPHIAFVDIQMPKYTGLEAINKLKKDLPLTQWIILTGYAQFDFAKEALSLGVREYLLKPLRPSKLKESFSKSVVTYKNQADKRAALFEQIARDCLQGNIIETKDKVFKLCLLYLERIDDFQLGLLKTRIKQELAIIYENQIDYALLKISKNELLLIMRYNKSREINFNIDRIIQIIKNNNIVYWIFVSPLFKEAQELNKAVKKIKKYGKNYLGEKCFSLIDINKKINEVPQEINNYLLKIKNTLSYIEKKNNIENIRKILNNLKKSNHVIADNIYSNIKYILQKDFSQIKDMAIVDNYSDLLNLTPSISPQIADVVNYIDQHYFEDIGIKQIAYLIGFSPNYLSAKFKSEMKIRFIDYLTQKRIERACFLLKNSNFFIHKIAKEVGFKDVKHFSKVFKEYKGCIPSEY